MYSSNPIDKWRYQEIGPYQSHTLDELDSRTMYAVKVQAKMLNGGYGNVSDVAVTPSRKPGA